MADETGRHGGTRRRPEGRRRERRGRRRWLLLALLVLVALGLGAAGFDRHARATGEPHTPAGLLYLALQLFTLESGGLAGRLPWQLEVARFLAPALTLLTAAQALALLFRDELQGLRARRRRGHVVVCGLGREGQLLARRFRAAGERVVAVERRADEPGVQLCRDAGAVVLVGDATRASTLRRAGVGRARLLVATCGGDGDNAAVAVAASRLVAGRRRPPLVAVAHLLDVELRALLRERELMATERSGFRLELFDVYESGAEAMLEEIPWRRDAAPHVVVVGLGRLGRAVLTRLLRHGDPTMPRPRVTVVDRDPGRLAHARSAGGADGRVTAHELDVRSADFRSAGFLLDDAGRPTASGVYVCLGDEGAALAAALALHRRLAGTGVPIAVRLEEESGLATLLLAGAGAAGELRPFGLLDRTCRPERLLAGGGERLAQALHEGHRARRRAAAGDDAEGPALAPWALLAEELRESSRSQADDIGRQLAAAGCEIVAADSAPGEPFAFAAAEIERLAELEHQRFVAERTAAGWSYAPGPGDPRRRTSPYLVPWSQLDDTAREIDRATVRELPAFLAALGFEVRRRAAAGGRPSEADRAADARH